MYTAIIAEDEILVRLGLSISVDWEKLNIRVVAEVANGTDAYEAYLKYRPDIVVTDIRMPGMDGLALIRKIREADARCAVIVVSALTDFSTLHSVMQNDAVAYLIKASMTQDEICGAIEKAIDHLKRHAHADGGAERVPPRVRVHELVRRYGVSRELTLAALHAELRALGAQPPEIAGALLASVDGMAPNGAATLAGRSVRRLLLQRLAPDDGDMRYEQDGTLLVLFCGSRPPLPAHLELLAREEDEYAKDTFRMRLRLCYCQSAIPLSDMPAFIDAAHAAVGVPWLFHAQTLRLDAAGMIDDDALGRLIDALVRYVDRTLYSLHEWKEARHALDRLRPALPLSRREFIGRLKALARLLLCGREEEGSVVVVEAALESAASLRDAIDAFEAGVLFRAPADDAANGARLAAVMRYMQEHLQEDLHLSQMAEMANLSPGYFSTLLKQWTGIRFSEYVSTLRIEQAKALLKNPALSIQQVAERCGLPDIAYFSRSFKNRVGASPSQWRKA